jgi:hypothetical protein
MRMNRILIMSTVVLMTVGVANADFKVVQQHHQDGFSMMGQSQPPTDEEHVTWIGDKKLRMDQGSSSTIVLVEAGKMVMLDHDDKTFTEVDLPVDLASLMPPGMAEQMMAMLKFEVTVTATDETKKVGEWNARRYNMKMASSMMSLDSVIWASTETPIDDAAFFDMFSVVMSLQPGMDSMLEQMQQIDGYVVSQQGTMSMTFMGETTVGSSDVVVSIDQLDAPPGTYDSPAGYAKEEFDFVARMQNQ